jgi:hypothetical protein
MGSVATELPRVVDINSGLLARLIFQPQWPGKVPSVHNGYGLDMVMMEERKIHARQDNKATFLLSFQ